MSAARLLRGGIVVGCGVLAGRAIWERLAASDGPDPVSGSRYRDTLGWRLYDGAAAAADRCVGWDKLPTPLGLAVLIGLRNVLRQENLYDTSDRAGREHAARAAARPRVPRHPRRAGRLQRPHPAEHGHGGLALRPQRPARGDGARDRGEHPRAEPAPRQPRAPDAHRVPAGRDAQPVRRVVDPVHDQGLVQPRARRPERDVRASRSSRATPGRRRRSRCCGRCPTRRGRRARPSRRPSSTRPRTGGTARSCTAPTPPWRRWCARARTGSCTSAPTGRCPCRPIPSSTRARCRASGSACRCS